MAGCLVCQVAAGRAQLAGKRRAAVCNAASSSREDHIVPSLPLCLSAWLPVYMPHSPIKTSQPAVLARKPRMGVHRPQPEGQQAAKGKDVVVAPYWHAVPRCAGGKDANLAKDEDLETFRALVGSCTSQDDADDLVEALIRG